MLQILKILFLRNFAQIPVEVSCINGRSAYPSKQPIQASAACLLRCIKRNVVSPSQMAGQGKKFCHCKAIKHVTSSLNMFNYFCSMCRENVTLNQLKNLPE
jgi:hypothetical protein